MWGPPVISWFISPINYIVISTINHSYWSYVHQLSYLGGPTLQAPPLCHQSFDLQILARDNSPTIGRWIFGAWVTTGNLANDPRSPNIKSQPIWEDQYIIIDIIYIYMIQHVFSAGFLGYRIFAGHVHNGWVEGWTWLISIAIMGHPGFTKVGPLNY